MFKSLRRKRLTTNTLIFQEFQRAKPVPWLAESFSPNSLLYFLYFLHDFLLVLASLFAAAEVTKGGEGKALGPAKKKTRQKLHKVLQSLDLY